MELGISEQIFEHINRANKILLALPEQLTADSLSSGLALAMFLEKLEKDVNIVSTGEIPENLKFLPKTAVINKELKVGKSMVVSINTATKELAEISYHKEKNKVNIYLKPKGEMYNEEDVNLNFEKFPIDLIILVDVRALEGLGKLFEQNPEVFYETPKVNIDNQASNEYFGSINLVDIAASSVSEVVANLLENFEKEMVDEDMATCLLTGIITKTNSFQHVQTTPKALVKASQLVSLGGRQQEIIKNIFKTKPVSLLRLWGRALTKLKTHEQKSLIYSSLNPEDFKQSQAAPKDLIMVLKELIDNVSNFKLMGILAEVETGMQHLYVAAHPQVNVKELVKNLGGGKDLEFGWGQLKVVVAEFKEENLQKAEEKLLTSV